MKNKILLRFPKNWGLDEKLVVKMMGQILEKRGYKKDTELSLVFVGQKKAKDLNIKYRNMSYIPQVLGFPMNKEKSADGYIRLGDIVICTQKLKDEVKFQKSNFETILYDWLNHGVNNLLI
jgi:rRNA maturation RNase YbeY